MWYWLWSGIALYMYDTDNNTVFNDVLNNEWHGLSSQLKFHPKQQILRDVYDCWELIIYRDKHTHMVHQLRAHFPVLCYRLFVSFPRGKTQIFLYAKIFLFSLLLLWDEQNINQNARRGNNELLLLLFSRKTSCWYFNLSRFFLFYFVLIFMPSSHIDKIITLRDCTTHPGEIWLEILWFHHNMCCLVLLHTQSYPSLFILAEFKDIEAQHYGCVCSVHYLSRRGTWER